MAALGAFVAGFPCSFASRWAFVVKFNLIFFIPEVKLSISDVWDVEGSMLGRGTSLDFESVAPSAEVACAVESEFNGDFLRTRDCFGASFRGCAGARVFLTTTGGIECPLELIAESGLTLWAVPGRRDIAVSPLDGACKFKVSVRHRSSSRILGSFEMYVLCCDLSLVMKSSLT